MRAGRDGWSVEEGLSKGRAPPDWWHQRPYIPMYARFMLQAFDDLSTDRSISVMSGGNRIMVMVGSIPWSSIERYADGLRLDADNRSLFHDAFRAMDSVYRPWRSEEIVADLTRMG